MPALAHLCKVLTTLFLNQSLVFLTLATTTTAQQSTTTQASTTTGAAQTTTLNTASTTQGASTTTANSTQCSSEKYDYGKVLELSHLFYEAQRSGPLPSDNRIPWRGNSSLGDKGEKGEDLTGGYHDAGDYVKFGLPMAGAMTVLAYGGVMYEDGYKAAGQFSYLQDTVKYVQHKNMICLIIYF